MAEMDMGIAPKKKKSGKKRKKQNLFMSIVTGLIPWKGDSVTEIFRKIIFLMALTVLVVAVVIIAQNMLMYARLGSETGGGTEGDTATNNKYFIDIMNREPTREELDKLPSGTINEKFATLYAENQDFIGWLTIPGTNIDYPVVQTEDNDYYLHRDFNGEYKFEGTIFADCDGPITADSMPHNTVLYGHNMLYKYQFSALTNYVNNMEFLKLSPVIEFDTLYSNNKYMIIAVFRTNTSAEHGEVFKYTCYPYFHNQSEFYDFVLNCMDRSMYQTGVDIEYGDEFLTLSTCDGSTGFEDARTVIVARKVRNNEYPSVDTSQIVRKDSVKYFDSYYKVYGNTWKGRTWDLSLVKGIDVYIKENGLEE